MKGIYVKINNKISNEGDENAEWKIYIRKGHITADI